MSKRDYIPNPTGKNGRDPHAIALRTQARTHTEEALSVLLEAMRNGDDLKLRMEAASHILDRAWGKPSQQIDLMQFDHAHEQRQAEYAARGEDEYGISELDRFMAGT